MDKNTIAGLVIAIVVLSLVCTFSALLTTGTPLTQESMRHTFGGWLALWAITAIVGMLVALLLQPTD